VCFTRGCFFRYGNLATFRDSAWISGFGGMVRDPMHALAVLEFLGGATFTRSGHLHPARIV
jgi:hypothetical protein